MLYKTGNNWIKFELTLFKNNKNALATFKTNVFRQICDPYKDRLKNDSTEQKIHGSRKTVAEKDTRKCFTGKKTSGVIKIKKTGKT